MPSTAAAVAGQVEDLKIYKYEDSNHGNYPISLSGEIYKLTENCFSFTPQILWCQAMMNCRVLIRDHGLQYTQVERVPDKNREPSFMLLHMMI